MLWDDDLIGECNELVGAAFEQVFRRCAVSSVLEVKVILLSFFTVCYFEHTLCTWLEMKILYQSCQTSVCKK